MNDQMSVPGGMLHGQVATPVVMTFPGMPQNGLDVVLDWNSACPPGNNALLVVGELFLVESGSTSTEECRITHRRWLLCGCGSDFSAALADLEAQAVIVAPAYVDQPDAKLSEGACTLLESRPRAIWNGTNGSE